MPGDGLRIKHVPFTVYSVLINVVWCIVVFVDVRFEAFEFEEDEAVTNRGDLEVHFEKLCGENKGIPSFTNGPGAKKCSRWEECDDSVDETMR